MAGHTPGPWSVAYHDGNDQAVVSGQHTEIATCWHHCVVELETQMQANARLISAAPDMLEALEAAVADLEQTLRWRGEGWECSEDKLLGKARAAIAKARGAA